MRSGIGRLDLDDGRRATPGRARDDDARRPARPRAVPASIVAFPAEELAAQPKQRQGQLHDLGQRSDRAGRHDVPRLPMVGVDRRVPRRGPRRRRCAAVFRLLRRMAAVAAPGGGLQEARLLADRVDERGVADGKRHCQRQSRIPAAAADVEQRPARFGSLVGTSAERWTAPRGCRRRASRAIASGVRSAVRLMATFHASSSRACASIATRAPGAREMPSASSPSSRVASKASPSGGRPSGSIGSGARSRRSRARPAHPRCRRRVVVRCRGNATGAAPPHRPVRTVMRTAHGPDRSRRRHPSRTLDVSVFHPPVGRRLGFLRPPSRRRYRTWSGSAAQASAAVVQGAAVSRCRSARVNGVFHDLTRRAEGCGKRERSRQARAADYSGLGRGERTGRPMLRRTTSMTSSVYGPASPVLTAVARQPGDVVLHQQQGHGVDRCPQRGGLLEDVDAVLLALDHAGDAPDLPLDPGKPAQELSAILLITARRGGASLGRCRGRCRWVRHTGWEYSARTCKLDVSEGRSE